MPKIDFKEVVEKVTDELLDKNMVDGVDERFPVSVPEVKHLRGEKGLTYEQIGRIFGVSKQAIHSVCKKYHITNGGIKKYKGVREANWLHAEEQLLDLTRNQINKIKPGNRLVNAAIAFDKVQILSGQPTQVVAYVDLVEAYKQIKAEEAKLGKDVIDVTPEEDEEADPLNAP